MRYQENKKNSKGPIIAFVSFVVIGGGLVFFALKNEAEPEIVGGTRQEVQGLVDIYSEQTMANISDNNLNLDDISFSVEDEVISDKSNSKFKASITLPTISIDGENLTVINAQIKDKYTELFSKLKDEMTTMENNFTFKTSYKYYENKVADKRVLSVTIHQRIVDDSASKTTTDKIETYNIDLSTKEIIDESKIAQSLFGKEYKTVIKNKVKEYVVDNNMIDSDKYNYSLTGLENYYIKDGVFHIVFNESEIVDKKYGVIDIEIKE